MRPDRRSDFARASCLLALILLCSAFDAFAAVPSPWVTQDVGSPALAGSASFATGTFTVTGGGRDIWGTSDQFRFVYQRVTGDFQIIARVDSISQAHEWSKAGLMLRTSLTADAPHGYVLVSAARGIGFQYRTQPAGLSTSIVGATGAAPRWLKLVRTGTLVKAYMGSDGGNWTAIGTSTIPAGTTAYAGIAVTSHNTAALATAAVSQVSISVGSLAIPSSQRTVDIGAPAIAGSTTYSGGTYTIQAAGTDMWGTSDQGHFVYQPITGDVDIVARVASLKNTNAYAKAGVMIRESLSAGSRHAFALTSPGGGYAFNRRIDPGGFTVKTSGGAGTAPGWVRLVRTGYQFKAFRSADGVTWTSMGTDTVPMSDSVYVGLAVTSHTVSASTIAVVDNLKVTFASAPSESAAGRESDRTGTRRQLHGAGKRCDECFCVGSGEPSCAGRLLFGHDESRHRHHRALFDHLVGSAGRNILAHGRRVRRRRSKRHVIGRDGQCQIGSESAADCLADRAGAGVHCTRHRHHDRDRR